MGTVYGQGEEYSILRTTVELLLEIKNAVEMGA
jgi:hypothetical protein